MLDEILLTYLREEMKSSESEDAGHCCKTRLTQRGEEPPSPNHLLRNSLKKEGYGEGLDDHEPRWTLRRRPVSTSKPERMKHAGHHKVHDERSQNHPHQPEQRTPVDAQPHTDMPASVKRATQDIAQDKSEHHRRPINQQHTRPHREGLQEIIGILMCESKGLDRRNLFQQGRRERAGEHHRNRDDNAQHLSSHGQTTLLIRLISAEIRGLERREC